MSAPDPIEQLIARLPAHERQTARASIRIAATYGWCDFACWTDPYGEPPLLENLIAVDAEGRLHFLSDVD